MQKYQKQKQNIPRKKLHAGKKPSVSTNVATSNSSSSTSPGGGILETPFLAIPGEGSTSTASSICSKKPEYLTNESNSNTCTIYTKKMSSDNNIYHEKQIRSMCALHALNNLFQEEYYSKEQLDNICNQLSPDTWVNPHKSVLGLGNYDINVIIKALEVKGYEVVWFDKRTNPNTINLSAVFGFILNVPTDTKVGWLSLPLKRKHWYSIRNLGEDYYNLDSKLEQPGVIGKAPDLVAYLQNELQSDEKALLLVVTPEVSKDKTWNTQSQSVTSSSTTSTSTTTDTANVNPNSKSSKSNSTDSAAHSDSASSSLNNHLQGLNSQVRKESADSGVDELLERDGDLNIVDCNQEDERYS